MTPTPFDDALDQTRAELDVANDAFNVVHDRICARTSADDDNPADVAEVRALFRQVQVDCFCAGVLVDAFETMQRQWRAAEIAGGSPSEILARLVAGQGVE